MLWKRRMFWKVRAIPIWAIWLGFFLARLVPPKVMEPSKS